MDTEEEIVGYVISQALYNESTLLDKYRYYIRWNGKTIFAPETRELVEKIMEIEGVTE